MDKYGMIAEMQKKLDLAADARGTLRGGLLWDVACMMKTLQNGLKADDEAHNQKIEALKAQIQAMGKGDPV